MIGRSDERRAVNASKSLFSRTTIAGASHQLLLQRSRHAQCASPRSRLSITSSLGDQSCASANTTQSSLPASNALSGRLLRPPISRQVVWRTMAAEPAISISALSPWPLASGYISFAAPIRPGSTPSINAAISSKVCIPTSRAAAFAMAAGVRPKALHSDRNDSVDVGPDVVAQRLLPFALRHFSLGDPAALDHRETGNTFRQAQMSAIRAATVRDQIPCNSLPILALTINGLS